MSEELEKLLKQLEALAEKSKAAPSYIDEIEAMRSLLFEAAIELAPIKLSTLRHLASIKLSNDGVVQDYRVTGKHIRDLFCKYDKSELLPPIQKVK
jgi:hypothetical protein